MEPPQRMGQQDPRLHGYQSYYSGPPHSMMMMPQHQVPPPVMRQGFPNLPHMPPMPHGQPMQSYNPGRPRAQQYNVANSMGPMQPVTAPSYKKPRPTVIVVLGYRRVGKTSVAKRLAEVRNFKYISLKPKGNESSATPKAYVSPLVELLERKNRFDGIVIDDIVVHNKFEPYYVQSVLQQHGLKLDMAVVLDNDLEITKERDVDYSDPIQRNLHPESYEFCASYLQGEPIHVVECREKSLEETVADAQRQEAEARQTKETSLSLKDVELMAKCPLERNPTLVTEIIEAQIRRLNLHESAQFPYSEPNYLLEYAVFARRAYAFRSYMVTPWMQGTKVALIGYQNAVYIYLPGYNVVFGFNEAPAALLRLTKEMKGEDGLSFIFEATFAKDKFYISELLILGENTASKMLAHERVDMLKEKLGDLNDEKVELLPWYPVQSMEKCVSSNPQASGVLFVNPDGVMFGEFDSQNFLYPLPKKKTVELRIWNGAFNGGIWSFDAYCEDSGNEQRIEGVPVHISDADVTVHCINDGNILECLREDYTTGPKTRKGARHYVFQSRCQWLLKPTTVHKQDVYVSDPMWPLERVVQACATIKHVPALRPEERARETATADG
ncbi:hypothetical protein DQ04_18321000 [Trypanosoma grayi]|uniref:hypothetical protein n=1 Tax=Trypanosoma grayi TaxID=71804 RepID=UPI0004F4539E|nr:hypothetical protein DQ04_18321000 [Trypanosoma grayi]KEG05801.1 hypothetical protein DQ04_18321000 [Trypanosoma grayi]